MLGCKEDSVSVCVSSVASFELVCNCIICRIGPGLLDRRVLIRGFVEKAGFYGIHMFMI